MPLNAQTKMKVEDVEAPNTHVAVIEATQAGIQYATNWWNTWGNLSHTHNIQTNKHSVLSVYLLYLARGLGGHAVWRLGVHVRGGNPQPIRASVARHLR